MLGMAVPCLAWQHDGARVGRAGIKKMPSMVRCLANFGSKWVQRKAQQTNRVRQYPLSFVVLRSQVPHLTLYGGYPLLNSGLYALLALEPKC